MRSRAPVLGSYAEPLREIDTLLREGKDRKAEKRVRALSVSILDHAWEDPALGAVLAELALARAVVAARAKERDAALWWWQTGLHLDPSLASRDLVPYGDLGGLAGEGLRRPGALAPGYADIRPPLRKGERAPRVPALSGSPLLENAGARRDGVPPVTVEVLIGTDGRMRQPRVLTENVRPIVLYACLERLAEHRALPAEKDGAPVGSLFPIEISFARGRW